MRISQFTRPQRRRGISSILAMIYLTLFSALAIGFYTSVNMAVQVSDNDTRTIKALAAAESGLDFMRYQLANVVIPPNTAVSQSFGQLFNCLKSQLNGTSNMRGLAISQTGNTISIPGSPDQYVYLDSTGTSAFRVTITDWAGEIVVKVTGRYATPGRLAAGMPAVRTVTMDFTRQNRPTQSFMYAVASRGQVVMSRGGVLSTDPANRMQASVMSASATSAAINMSGGVVDGNLAIVNGASALVTGGTVNGESNTSMIYRDHVAVVDPPEFPMPDTSVYKGYAVNNYVSGRSIQQNIRIPAGTNPQFAGGDTVQGIMYIESPNKVTFRGNFNLQGFIVFEQADSSAVNTIDFRGSVMQFPLPSDAQFDPMRATTGVSILAPTALLSMSGATSSSLIGNVMVDRFAFNGSADIQIDRGTLMTFNQASGSTTFSGKNVRFTATGAGNLPSPGLSYSTYFAPKPGSYNEIMP